MLQMRAQQILCPARICLIIGAVTTSSSPAEAGDLEVVGIQALAGVIIMRSARLIPDPLVQMLPLLGEAGNLLEGLMIGRETEGLKTDLKGIMTSQIIPMQVCC